MTVHNAHRLCGVNSYTIAILSARYAEILNCEVWVWVSWLLKELLEWNFTLSWRNVLHLNLYANFSIKHIFQNVAILTFFSFVQRSNFQRELSSCSCNTQQPCGLRSCCEVKRFWFKFLLEPDRAIPWTLLLCIQGGVTSIEVLLFPENANSVFATLVLLTGMGAIQAENVSPELCLRLL